MKKLLFFILVLPVFAWGQQLPPANDTVRIAGQGAVGTLSGSYGFDIYGNFISYIKRGTSTKYDFYPSGAYLRKNYVSKSDSLIFSNLLTKTGNNITLGGDATQTTYLNLGGQLYAIGSTDSLSNQATYLQGQGAIQMIGTSGNNAAQVGVNGIQTFIGYQKGDGGIMAPKRTLLLFDSTGITLKDSIAHRGITGNELFPNKTANSYAQVGDIGNLAVLNQNSTTQTANSKISGSQQASTFLAGDPSSGTYGVFDNSGISVINSSGNFSATPGSITVTGGGGSFGLNTNSGTQTDITGLPIYFVARPRSSSAASDPDDFITKKELSTLSDKDSVILNQTAISEPKSFRIAKTGEVDSLFNVGGYRGNLLSPGDSPHKLDIAVYDPTNSTFGIRAMFYGNIAGNANFHYGKVRGTPTSPLAVQAQDYLYSMGLRGYGATGMLGSTGAFQFLAGENFTDAAAGTFSQLSLAPLGSLIRTINYRFDYSGYFTTSKLYLGNVSTTAGATFNPTGARIQMVGGITAPAWGANGINIASPAVTFTDNSSSGTVANNYINFFGTPTVAASSATSYTTSATIFIQGAPAFGTNATNGGNTYALYVGAGLSRFSGGMVLTGSQSVPSWTTNSPQFDAGATTLTDNSSAAAATIGMRVGRSFNTTTFGSTNSITVTNAINGYFAAPAAGTNTTATNLYAAWFNGNVNITGTPTIPTAAAGTSTTQAASTAFVTTADNLKANLASPALTGTPTAPTATAGTNSTQIATTAYVDGTTGTIIGTPSIAAGTGAGTSPTISVTSNTRGLQVTLTVGSLPVGVNATVATITLANALPYTPYPVYSSANGTSSLLSGATMVYMTSSGASNVTITSGTTALPAGTYIWNIKL